MQMSQMSKKANYVASCGQFCRNMRQIVKITQQLSLLIIIKVLRPGLVINTIYDLSNDVKIKSKHVKDLNS